jgi:acid phosphatase
MMHKPRLKKIAAAISAGLILAGPLQTMPPAYAEDGGRDDGGSRSDEGRRQRTESPIEHVIVVIPENRSFDHTYATYQPKHGQTVSNLLAKGIVRADGTPGPNFGLGAQFTVPPQTSFYIAAPAKTPYAVLPAPDTNGAPTASRDTAPPFKTAAEAAVEPDVEVADQVLLTTGATGLPTRSVDTRVTNAAFLPNGPFQLTGPTMPYDAYTGDTIHRLFQMWQQSDCSLVNATHRNPSGCLNDLFPFVNTTFNTNDNGVGNSMAILNMNSGDAPLFKRLADEFSMSDNFHQSVMGGTAANHVMLGTGDAVYFSDGNGNALAPAANLVANPNPKPGTNNNYTVDGNWANCADSAQPGVAAIVSYLASLPYAPVPNCEAGHFYMINNINPGFRPNGQLATGNVVPPSTRPTIGDALNTKNISWAYFGGAFNAAVNLANGSTNPADAIGAAYCQICNPFQYAKSIMGDPAQRAAHMKDTADLIAGIRDDTLPAVSFAKPDGLLDGHPQSSKLGLFEAYLKNILDTLDGNPKLKAKTAVFVVFDEGGGYWDSGFLQPLDFFGDGPRIPFLAISEFSRGGHVIHSYTDHVSILKFIERNWRLAPLTARSRDNLPNPIGRRDNSYVPVNMPAIGDLFDMFNFGDGDRDEHHDR